MECLMNWSPAMHDKPSRNITRANWIALQQITLYTFRELRRVHPEWTVEDLLSAQNLPATALLTCLAEKSGFQPRPCANIDEVLRVGQACMRGVWSAVVIAAETGIPLHRVQHV